MYCGYAYVYTYTHSQRRRQHAQVYVRVILVVYVCMRVISYIEPARKLKENSKFYCAVNCNVVC